MFDEVITLYDEYYRLLDRQQEPAFIRDLASEVRERLQQMTWIVRRARELEAIADAAFARSKSAFVAHVERLKAEGLDYEKVPAPDEMKLTTADYRAHSDATFELKLLTESFYYVAGRARSLLRHKRTPVPGLESFECVGVRNVRNKLLEHPEGSDSQVFIQSWAWGNPRGPVLKAVRYGGQEEVFPDAGLYANAEQFRDNLASALRRTLAARGP